MFPRPVQVMGDVQTTATDSPSLDTSISYTLWVWPVRMPMHSRVSKFHTRTMPPLPIHLFKGKVIRIERVGTATTINQPRCAVVSTCPLPLNDRAVTAAVWPSKKRCLFVSTSSTTTVLPAAYTTTLFPGQWAIPYDILAEHPRTRCRLKIDSGSRQVTSCWSTTGSCTGETVSCEDSMMTSYRIRGQTCNDASFTWFSFSLGRAEFVSKMLHFLLLEDVAFDSWCRGAFF